MGGFGRSKLANWVRRVDVHSVQRSKGWTILFIIIVIIVIIIII